MKLLIVYTIMSSSLID